MSYVRFDPHWQYNGCRVLRLESDQLCVDVLPECGGRIQRFYHKPDDRECLWQHPRIHPRPLPTGTNYDDHFAGGWDDLFPNGGPVTHEGEVYPDHGELWTRPCEWDVDERADEITLHLRAEGAVTPTRIERSLTLRVGSPALRCTHRLTHLGDHAFDYLWAQHPAMPADPRFEVIVPAKSGRLAALPGCTPLEGPIEFTWPHAPTPAGAPIDLRRVPDRDAAPGHLMAYLTELHAGWYAVLDRSTGSGFGLAFDRNIFNTVWLFRTCGGWRGLHVLILEPCTGYPHDLAEAARSGRCARLAPGQVIETSTAAVAIRDRDDIERIDVDGRVT